MPLNFTCAKFRLDVDAFFSDIMTLYIVQMPGVYTCQDDSVVRHLTVVDAALAVVILRIDSQIAPDAPNETFHGVISLENWS